jgi:V/A-type H+-transporting ATPase subunit E
MSGIDEILNMIGTQQKDNEDRIIAAAETKAAQIQKEADEKAARAYDESVERAKQLHQRNYENACSSVDTEMKRRILDCKVELIDETVAKVLEKLRSLPDKEYFSLIAKMIKSHIKGEKGTVYFGKDDLKRLPADLSADISSAAEKVGGSLVISDVPAEISDGFVLEYGLISENCSFSAVLEAEKEGVRDLAARHLFGQVN